MSKTLLSYGLSRFGARIAATLVIRWVQWWLTTGRKYRDDYLGQQRGNASLVLLANERIVKFNGKLVLHSQLPPLPSKAFDHMMFPSKPRHLHPRTVLWPSFTNIAVTGRCRYHCWHCCAANRMGGQDDLPVSDWRQIIRQLQDAGVYYLGITGGEPLLREDLEEILACVDQRSVLAMATSGFGLTFERALRLKEAGVFFLLVSLDHHHPEIHDRIRGFPGAHQAAVQAIRYAQEAQLYTILQTIVTREFVATEEVWNLARLGKELGVQEIRCRGIVPAGQLLNIEKDALLTTDDQQMLLESINKINQQPDYPKVSLFEDFEHPSRFGCNAGAMHIYVDSNGNLCPCDFAPLSFGNLCGEEFGAVWARMQTALGSPQTRCLACFLAERFSGQDLRFPLPLELSREICRLYCTPNLPGAYV